MTDGPCHPSATRCGIHPPKGSENIGSTKFILNRKTELGKAVFFTNRVESNGRLAPDPLLPIVKPDVRISRIRLSCKRSSLPTLIRSAKYTIFFRNRLRQAEMYGPIVSLLQSVPFAPGWLGLSPLPWDRPTSSGRGDGPRQLCPRPPGQSWPGAPKHTK